MNISIIGFGNLAKAISKKIGLHPSVKLRVSAPSLNIGVTADGIETHSDNLAILPAANVIILAIKPAQMRTVLDEITPAIPKDCLIISLASGIQLAWFAMNKPIIRAMPNLAAATGQSATPLIANEFVSDAQKKVADDLFKTIGLTTWLTDEQHMDAFTALSGSGPAYVFLFMESMIDAAIELGLSREIATSFTLQTVKGALSLATSQNMSLTELRNRVTSFKGTTAAALDVLMNQDFSTAIHDAMHAAFQRAKELGQTI